MVVSLLGPIDVFDATAASAAEQVTITGVVVDDADLGQHDVTVEVLNAGPSATTNDKGEFTITVSPGVYDIRFTPPANSGLRSYLATGIDASTAPLRIILKPITVIHLDGVVRDGKNNHYHASLTFTPAAGGAATYVTTDDTGYYSVELLAGQYHIRVNTSGGATANTVTFRNPADFEQSQTYDIVLPMSTLTVSVRDLDGNPVTDASVRYEFTYPSTPDYDGFTYANPTPVDATTGDLALNLITGTQPANPSITLKNGLTIPLSIPQITEDKHLFLIFDRTTGSILIDERPPIVLGEPDRGPDAADWYHAPVTITWSSVDPAPSSGRPTMPPPVKVASEGVHQVITSSESCDPAGNCATGQVTVSIDMTAPTIKYEITPDANHDRWHNQTVTVTFTCDDALSGIASCPEPVTVDAEGADQEIVGTAVDKAGNRASVTATVSLDKTTPTIEAHLSQPSNGAGWNNGDVTVSFTCADALSGLATCSDPVTLTEDGPDQVVTGTATDKAGNTTTTTVTVSIDKTKPQITATRTAANGAGWNNRDVRVSFTCADELSDIATCTEPITLTEEGAGQSVTGTAADAAGNTASTTVSDINIDKTAPGITADVIGTKNAAGWYTAAPTIHYTCTDALSGIATCPADVRVGTDGADQTITRTAIDKAGNIREATVSDLDVDLTAPEVTIIGAVNGERYTLDHLPTVSCSTTDATSGVAKQAVLTVTRDPAGTYTATCSGGADVAGNTAAPTSISYTAIPTIAALIALTNQYISGSGAPQADGMIQNLDNKLLHGQICQYTVTVNRQTSIDNPTLTRDQAAELLYWAHILDPTC